MALNNYQTTGADEESKSESPLRPANMTEPDKGTYQMTGADAIDLNRAECKPPYSDQGRGQFQMTGADEVELSRGENFAWAHGTSSVKPL